MLKFTDYIGKQAKAYDINLPHRGYDIYAFVKDLLAWVEKLRDKDKDKLIQKLSKQKYMDNDGTKFYKGEWVVFNASKSVYQVEKIEKYAYALRHILGGSLHLPFCHDDFIKEWTIQDAKDGDVLVYETDEVEWVLIYKEIVKSSSEVPHDFLRYYFLLADNKCNCKGVCAMVTENYEEYLKPATKEQRDLLFAKMKEAGYEWNANKKELKKIEDESENFKQQLMPEMYDLDKEFFRQKIAWSEDDERKIKNIVYFLETAKKHYASTVELDACIDWLKTLKQRIGGKVVISEDYVSLEVAKLLKKKGFQSKYDVPTLQMAMKWLREEKEIYITIVYGDYPSLNKVFWTPQIDSLEGIDLPDSFYKEYNKYEEACEAAIKYCLENLI